MSKRPAIDLSLLTSEAAAPMPEAAQRSAHVVTLSAPPSPAPSAKPAPVPAQPEAPPPAAETRTRTENLEALAFKVSPAFRKRFRQRAVDADLKLNELLFEALDEWEKARKIKR